MEQFHPPVHPEVPNRPQGPGKQGKKQNAAAQTSPPITKADLFALGLSGGPGAAERRGMLLKKLDLPEHLTANGMLEALNLLYDRESLARMLQE